jgi:hypothetical protein
MVTTLVKCPESVAVRLVRCANDPAWQRAWLSLEAEDWRSLTVLPTGELSSLDLVHGLASVAWQQRGTPLVIADLREIRLASLAAAKAELRRHIVSGERVLIAVHSVDKNPTTEPLLKESDKTVLCIHKGLTKMSHVKNAVRVVGAQRCLGAILFDSTGIVETTKSVVVNTKSY